MTDKEKLTKVRAEVERLHNEYRNKKGAFYFRKALRTVLFIIDSMLEEPEYLEEETTYCAFSTSRYTDKERKALCKGCEEECRFNKKEEPVSEEFEKALAEEWQGYVDRGAATVDALEDNTQELAFAKGFYRGTNWQKEQMLAKAVEGKVLANGMGNPILHLWDKGKHLIDKKVKVIIIKEE